MVFKKLSVGGRMYGASNDENNDDEIDSPQSATSSRGSLNSARASTTMKAVDFRDADFMATIASPYMANHNEIVYSVRN